jgi:hypothetical protein
MVSLFQPSRKFCRIDCDEGSMLSRGPFRLRLAQSGPKIEVLQADIECDQEMPWKSAVAIASRDAGFGKL